MEFEFSFLTITVVACLFFSNWKARIVLVAYNLAFYLATKYYLIDQVAVYEEFTNPWFGTLVFFATLITIITLINSFSRISYQAEDNIHANLKIFHDSNQALNHNKTLIEQQIIKLKQANLELEKFMYVASHDLKAPLRSISSFTSLIKRKLKNHQDPDIHEYLDFTTKGTIQMQRLIDDILTFSKIGQQMNIQTVDLNKLIISVQYTLNDQITATHSTLKIDQLPTIQADKNLIKLLFHNLIDNAICYNESPFPIIEINYLSENNFHLFTIRDNGIGIGKEHYDLIFEMFKRLHTQVTYQGSGIGLATCKKIVELMNGQIWVESKEGRGSQFFIQLPMQ